MDFTSIAFIKEWVIPLVTLVGVFASLGTAVFNARKIHNEDAAKKAAQSQLESLLRKFRENEGQQLRIEADGVDLAGAELGIERQMFQGQWERGSLFIRLKTWSDALSQGDRDA